MSGLTTYESAYLVGGKGRAALVAFIALAADGRLDVAYGRQRVKVARDEATDEIETAAFALVPESGLTVAEFIEQVAATEPVKALKAAIVAKGLLRPLRWFSPAYRELVAHPGTGLHRVAVLGVPGIEDERLRDILEHPRPEVPKVARHKSVTDNTLDGSIGPNQNTFNGP